MEEKSDWLIRNPERAESALPNTHPRTDSRVSPGNCSLLQVLDQDREDMEQKLKAGGLERKLLCLSELELILMRFHVQTTGIQIKGVAFTSVSEPSEEQ